jgi:hypothetical protein
MVAAPPSMRRVGGAEASAARVGTNVSLADGTAARTATAAETGPGEEAAEGEPEAIDASTDTGLDPICAHCPAVEPKSEDEADGGDGVCLHAYAYSCAAWCYVCPPELIPDWAAELGADVFESLALDRHRCQH